MCPDVYRQGAALDEALTAARGAALVQPLVGVYPVVSLQVGLAVETLSGENQVSDLDRNSVIARQKAGRRPAGRKTHLVAGLPVAPERARRGLVIHKFHQFHLSVCCLVCRLNRRPNGGTSVRGRATYMHSGAEELGDWNCDVGSRGERCLRWPVDRVLLSWLTGLLGGCACLDEHESVIALNATRMLCEIPRRHYSGRRQDGERDAGNTGTRELMG